MASRTNSNESERNDAKRTSGRIPNQHSWDHCTCRPGEDPLNDPNVLPEARPEQAAVPTTPEPVDHEDGRGTGQPLAHAHPVAQVVPKVVAKEGAHGEGVVHHLAPLVLRRRCRLRFDACAWNQVQEIINVKKNISIFRPEAIF